MKTGNYYQSNIKTSRKEDGVYAMRYANQQMLIDKLQQENQQLKIQISAREEEYRKLEENWNKLKEYIDKTKIEEFEKMYGKRYGKTFTQAEIVICNMIKEKIKELEKKCK